MLDIPFRKLSVFLLAAVLLSEMLSACSYDDGDDASESCADKDGDGYGANCENGEDCDDSDADVFAGCAGDDDDDSGPESVTVDILATDGGQVALSSGDVVLEIPAGALSSDARIIITEKETSGLPDADQLHGFVVEIEPADTTLSEDATLTIAIGTEPAIGYGVKLVELIEGEWKSIVGTKLSNEEVVANIDALGTFALELTGKPFDGTDEEAPEFQNPVIEIEGEERVSFTLAESTEKTANIPFSSSAVLAVRATDNASDNVFLKVSVIDTTDGGSTDVNKTAYYNQGNWELEFDVELGHAYSLSAVDQSGNSADYSGSLKIASIAETIAGSWQMIYILDPAPSLSPDILTYLTTFSANGTFTMCSVNASDQCDGVNERSGNWEIDGSDIKYVTTASKGETSKISDPTPALNTRIIAPVYATDKYISINPWDRKSGEGELDGVIWQRDYELQTEDGGTWYTSSVIHEEWEFTGVANPDDGTWKGTKNIESFNSLGTSTGTDTVVSTGTYEKMMNQDYVNFSDDFLWIFIDSGPDSGELVRHLYSYSGSSKYMLLNPYLVAGGN